MPYIDKQARRMLMNTNNVQSAGEIQYLIAIMIKTYIQQNGLSYQTCNDVMGALAGAQMEFYRRTVAPYEDEKIKENGDI